jgi:hypothetical protein
MNIEAQIKNWQNKFNKGEASPCRECRKPVYMDKKGSYSGPCPYCNIPLNYSTEIIKDNFNLSDGGSIGIGKKRIYRKHLIAFAVWWIISVAASIIVTGLFGVILAILFNVLLTSIGFRTFTFEIHHYDF